MSKQLDRELSWDEWVSVSLGSMLTADTFFDPMFLLAHAASGTRSTVSRSPSTRH
jgi:hypothetical protein